MDRYRASQTERITLIKVALLNKVGEGGVRHMGLSLDNEGHTGARQTGDIAGSGRPPDGQGRGDVRAGDTWSSGSGLDRPMSQPEPHTDEEGMFL